jgi:hypothetical protein
MLLRYMLSKGKHKRIILNERCEVSYEIRGMTGYKQAVKKSATCKL